MTGPEAPILDVAVLDELLVSVQHDRSFVVQLIEAFLGDGERQIEQIAAAGAVGDAEALVRPAHTLKSSSATVGAARMAELARSLEHAAREGHTDEAQASAGALPAAWSDASAALRAWVDGRSA
jgi:two-component system, sensor histidine kinase